VAVLFDVTVGVVVGITGFVGSCFLKNAAVDVGLTLSLVVRRIGDVGNGDGEASALVLKRLKREGGCPLDCGSCRYLSVTLV